MELSDADQVAMGEYLNSVLDAYKNGKIDRNRARWAIAHVMTAAASGDEREFKARIRQPIGEGEPA